MSAYMKHANALGYDSEDINAFMQATLAKTLDDSLSIDELISLTLETGKVGVDGMALLDSANTGTYGHPEMTKVNIGVGSKPGILVSGHDLRDLEQLLEQTEGTGVDVYTHTNDQSGMVVATLTQIVDGKEVTSTDEVMSFLTPFSV